MIIGQKCVVRHFFLSYFFFVLFRSGQPSSLTIPNGERPLTPDRSNFGNRAAKSKKKFSKKEYFSERNFVFFGNNFTPENRPFRLWLVLE
jgi:hypothetical protein